MPELMTEEEQHRERHREMHRSLDDLLGDYLKHHPLSRPSSITAMELLVWARQQAACPQPLPW
jgi:hypothetical protein